MISASGLIIQKTCRIILCLVWLFALLIPACTKSIAPTPAPLEKPKPYRVGNTWYKPVSEAKGFKARGIASWYGKKFHGRKTSSGEVYNMFAMTAAHKTLPLGTHLSVTNLNNNQKVIVRVNDRGPFARGRIIDLSYAAAKKLDMISGGTAPVEIVAIGADKSTQTNDSQASQKTGIDYYSGNFTFQIGAFKDKNNAVRLKNKLNERYQNVHITKYDTGQDILYRVRIGKVSSLEEAVSYESTLLQHGFKDVFIIAE